MLEYILKWDTELFLFLNAYHNAFLDNIMLFISDAKTWFPFYAFLIFIVFYKAKNWRIALLQVLMICLAVGLSDFIASGLMKPYFHRLRPCHEIYLLSKMTLVGPCGGNFGFVSSHAANSFALAFMLPFVFKIHKFSFLIYFWAFLVAFSRVYLGVHYPLDITVGAIIGTMNAFIFSSLMKQITIYLNKLS